MVPGANIAGVKTLAHEVVSSSIFTSGISEGKSSITKEKFQGKVPAGCPSKDENMAGAVLFTAANEYPGGYLGDRASLNVAPSHGDHAV